MALLGQVRGGVDSKESPGSWEGLGSNGGANWSCPSCLRMDALPGRV